MKGLGDPILPLSYYERMLTNHHFPKNGDLLSFADDIDWCKQQSFFDDDATRFNESNGRYSYQTYTDKTGKMQNTLLHLHLICKNTEGIGVWHSIIAHSSFQEHWC